MNFTSVDDRIEDINTEAFQLSYLDVPDETVEEVWRGLGRTVHRIWIRQYICEALGVEFDE